MSIGPAARHVKDKTDMDREVRKAVLVPGD